MIEHFQKQIELAREAGIPRCLLFYILENHSGTKAQMFKVREDQLDKVHGTFVMMKGEQQLFPCFRAASGVDLRKLDGAV